MSFSVLARSPSEMAFSSACRRRLSLSSAQIMSSSSPCREVTASSSSIIRPAIALPFSVRSGVVSNGLLMRSTGSRRSRCFGWADRVHFSALAFLLMPV
ncbi:hypothetical protein D3C80_1481370 [compost metagenome]